MKINITENRLVNQLVNESRVEIKMYIDLEHKCIDTSEDEKWLEEQINNGKVLLLPHKEELYPYKDAIKDFLCKFDLLVPDDMRVKEYLSEKGLMQTFYDFYEREIVEKLLEWCEKNQIELLTE